MICRPGLSRFGWGNAASPWRCKAWLASPTSSDQVFGELPPLLKTVRTELIRSLGTLDAEFLVMLDTARMVPESMWEALSQTKAAL